MSDNPSLRAALDRARRLGCAVQPVRRTGEIRVTPPLPLRPVVVNARRKDTPRALLVALRRLDPEGA